MPSERKFRTFAQKHSVAIAAVAAAAGFGLLLAAAMLFKSVMTIPAREKSRAIAPQTATNQFAAKAGTNGEVNLGLADESRQQLWSLQVLNGRRALEQGDDITAALWFAASLGTVKGDPQQERIHRLRLEWLLADYPRLTQVFLHPGPVNSCKFSPDGQSLVTSCQDGTARLWNAKTGDALTPPLQHNGAVVFATFSADGKSVLTASADGTAQLWSATSGAKFAAPLQHHGPITTASFNPRGDRVLTASSDGTAQVWDASNSAAVTPLLRHKGPVWCAAFSPDGKRVATGSADQTAQLWDANSGEPIGAPLQHEQEVVCLSFDPAGARLATGTARAKQPPSSAWLWNVEKSQRIFGPLSCPGRLRFVGFVGEPLRMIGAAGNGGVILWDVTNGRATTTQFKQLGAQHIAFSPDKRTAFTAAELNSTSHCWDVQNGKRVFPPLKHEFGATYADFSADGLQLLTASHDGLVRLWNMSSQSESLTLPHDGEVVTACFSPDGTKILTAGLERVARLWNSTNGELLHSFRNSNYVAQAMFSADGRRVLTSPGLLGWSSSLLGTTVCIWDASTGKLLGKPLLHRTNVLAAAISGDGQLAATATHDGVLRIWSVDRGEPVGPILQHSNSVLSIGFSPDSQKILTASSGGAAVWVWKTGALAFPQLKHDAPVHLAKYSPDGLRMVTGSQDGSLRIWDATTGNAITPPLRLSGPARVATFSFDGHRLAASANGSPRLRILDTTTGEQAVPPIEHSRAVEFAEFSPDGDLLVTASEDTAFVWDARSGDCVSPPLRHGNTIHQARFSSDGGHVATASVDRSARVWTLPHSEIRNMDLALLAELSAGQVYNKSGAFANLKPERVQAGLRELRARYPAYFSPSAADVMAWHDAQAIKAEAAGNWSSAVWHLKNLLEVKTADADVRRRCARAYLRSGHPAEALPLYEEMLKLMNSNHSLDDGKTLGVLEDLASAYSDAGRFAEAEGWYRELAAYWRITGGPDSLELGLALSSEGHCLLKQEKFLLAEPLLSESLVILKKQQPGLSPTYNAQSLLGASLLGQKKYQDAEPVLQEAYEGLKRRQQQRPSTSHAQQLQAAGRRLVQLYEAWGKPDKASEWKKNLTQTR